MATPVSTDLAVPGTVQRCSGVADLQWQMGNITRTAGEQRQSAAQLILQGSTQDIHHSKGCNGSAVCCTAPHTRADLKIRHVKIALLEQFCNTASLNELCAQH